LFIIVYQALANYFASAYICLLQFCRTLNIYYIMALTVAILSPDDKQILRDETERKIDGLNFAKLSLENRKQRTEESATQLDADIASTTAEINALDMVISTAPAGSSLATEMQRRKRGLENRLWSLNDRKSRTGTVAIVRIESQIGELDARIDTLNDHLTQLA
jgi:hypothetical protein